MFNYQRVFVFMLWTQRMGKIPMKYDELLGTYKGLTSRGACLRERNREVGAC